MFRIYDGRFEFYQWDLDRKLIVEDPTITEVHFCNKTDDCSLVVNVYEEGGKRLANVPNILLQSNWDIRVYGYCGDCYTKAFERFKVVGRTKPSDYVYTETEVRSFEAIEQRCEDVLALAETLAKGATAGESFMDYEALITDLNTAEKNKYFAPQHLLIRTLNVPDLWIYEVREESVPYEYIDDATLSNAVMEGVVQVGYFALSALETGKVKLDEYVEKDTSKITDTHILGRVYGIDKDGNQVVFDCISGITNSQGAKMANSIVFRDHDSNIEVGLIPYFDKTAVCKRYVEYYLPTMMKESDKEVWRTNLKLVSEDRIAVQGGVGVGKIPQYTNNNTLAVNTPTYAGEATTKKYVDDLVASSHMVNITQMQTVYNSEADIQGVVPKEGNGARYLVRTNGSMPLYYYSYDANAGKWEKGYQIKGSTLYVNLEDGCLYRYTNSTTTTPYPNFIQMTIAPEGLLEDYQSLKEMINDLQAQIDALKGV